MAYLVIETDQFVQYIDEDTGASLAEFDKETGYGSVGETKIGRYTDPEAAKAEIASLLSDPDDPSSPAHSRGIGPYTDKQGNIYQIVLPQYDLLKNAVSIGWAYELQWEPTHNGGAGVMYAHGPWTKNWMAIATGFPEYNPSDEGQTGTAADGRLPSTNALPPADSSATGDGTYSTSTVNFYGAVWTNVAGVLKRDGVPFQTFTNVVGLLVLTDDGHGMAGTHLFFELTDGSWQFFVPGNGVGLYSLVDDPRDDPTPPSSGPFYDWEASGVVSTLGSPNLTGISTAEYNSLVAGTSWVTFIKTIDLNRDSGIRGPGGMYPDRGVANVGALGSGSVGEVKYIAGGDVYQCDGGTNWFRKLEDPKQTSGNYYDRYIYSRALPKSLTGRVKTKLGSGAIELEDRYGNPLPAQLGMTGTLVVNNVPAINAAIVALAGGATGFELPNMLLPGVGVITIDRDNFELTCVNENSGVWTPRGCAYVGVQIIPGRTGCRVSHMTLIGNYKANDHGMNWADGPSDGLLVNGSPNPVTDWTIPGANYHGSCISFPSGCDGSVASGVWMHDYPNFISSSFCNDVWYQNLHLRLVNGGVQVDYTGWGASHNGCVGGGCEGADIVSQYSMKSLEAFLSRGPCIYRDNTLENGVMACNNSQMRMERNAFTWKVNSHQPGTYQTPNDFSIQISENAGGGYASLGVVVDVNSIVIEGETLAGTGSTKGGIEVNTDTIAIRPIIKNITHSAPNAVPSSYISGSRAVNAAHSELGGYINVSGTSPHHLNWGGAWQWAAIRATHDSIVQSGASFTTACDGHGHGGPDYEVW